MLSLSININSALQRNSYWFWSFFEVNNNMKYWVFNRFQMQLGCLDALELWVLSCIVSNLSSKLAFKGTTKLYFMHCSRSVIILFSTGLYKSAFSTYSLGKTSFSFLCVLVFHVFISLGFSFCFLCSKLPSKQWLQRKQRHGRQNNLRETINYYEK